MRDNRKNKAYFDSFLKYQYSRFENQTEKLKKADTVKKQRILLSLTGYELELLKAEFSAGASKETIKSLLKRATRIAEEYENITYEDLLNLLSLAIMVNYASAVENLVKNNIDRIKNDRLLNYLSMYILGNIPKWDNNLDIPEEFSGLNKVFVTDNKEAEMYEYLNGWYKNHSGYGWYNSHKGNSDTYCGYWSFESSAIAIILGINDDNLRKSVYYPYF